MPPIQSQTVRSNRCSRRYRKKGREQESPTPKVNPIYRMIQARERFNRFNSNHTKQKKAIAEISKSAVNPAEILLANACCRNNEGESNAEGSCRSQNQGSIEPAMVRIRYKTLIPLNGRVIGRFVAFNMVFILNPCAFMMEQGDNQSNYLPGNQSYLLRTL